MGSLGQDKAVLFVYSNRASGILKSCMHLPSYLDQDPQQARNKSRPLFQANLVFSATRSLDGDLGFRLDKGPTADPKLQTLDPKPYLRPQRPSALGFHIKNYTIGS